MESGRKQSVVEVTHSDNVLRVQDSKIRKMSVANPEFARVTHDAKGGVIKEKNMTFTQAIKLYPKAVGWSLLLSTAIVMEGYDISLLGNFYAFPQFRKRYGELVEGSSPPDYQVSAPWQSGLSNGAQVGEILGLYGAGVVVDAIGYRKTMLISLFAMMCFIFIPFFAQNLETLLVGEILQGVPWGVFQTMTTAYASEVAPVALRAYLTTYVNLCWVFGQLIAAGVLRSLLDRQDEWAYRIPFAIQWMWPLPIFVGCLFAPESPWWHVRKGHYDEAKKCLLRLTTAGADPTFSADETLAMMIHTNDLEKEISSGTSYWECFKGVDLRRTEIVSMVWVIQAFCGSAFMGFSTYFYENAGLATEHAFDLNMAQYALGAIGTMGSWFLMSHVGRRTIYVYGLLVMFIILIIIGLVGIAPSDNQGASWAVGSMLLIYTFVYDLTVGPVCYSLVAEISSTRLKAKSIVLARNFYNIGGIINNIIVPRMINPTAWNWGAKAALFWAGVCFLCLTWTYFRLPEPKGRTYGEMDVLFERGISARKFKGTIVDQFSGDTLEATDSGNEADVSGKQAVEYDEKF